MFVEVIHLKKMENRTISSDISNVNFFEKYNKIYTKIEELMGINFERKPPFCTNITYETLSSYSEDYEDIKIQEKEIIYKFSSVAILHS